MGTPVPNGQIGVARTGALDGAEGILGSCNGDRTLVISIDPIEGLLSVRLEGYRSRSRLTLQRGIPPS